MYRPSSCSKRRRQPDGLALADVDDVLGAPLLRPRRAAVAAEDLEVDQVHVQRVEPAAGGVLDLPDLGAARLDRGEDVLVPALHDVVPGLAVDDPQAVAALQPHPAGGHRRGRVQRHRPGAGAPSVLGMLLPSVLVTVVPTSNCMTLPVWS
jgi:hypothetical protein